MALPKHLRNGLSPAELAFVAESTNILIQPRQTMEKLELIDTTVPAFKPPRRVEVPLWLGLLLKKQRRARIIPPEWLQRDQLQILLKREEEEELFAPLPFQWLEISTALLDSANDDIDEPDLTRRLLRDLREVRLAKARKGIDTIGDTHVQMDNLGVMEINEIRFLSQAVDELRQLTGGGTDKEDDDMDTIEERARTADRDMSDDDY